MIPFIAIATIVILGATFGIEVYNGWQAHQDAGETIESMDLLSESLESFVDKLQNVFEDLAQVVYDAAMVIMQYMDAWGTVLTVLISVVIIMGFAILFNVAKLRRY